MAPQVPLRISITRSGDKEQKLKAFIRHYLVAVRPREGAGGDADDDADGVRPRSFAHLHVVARSMESPVVRALAGLTQEIATAGLGVRLILAQREDVEPPMWPDTAQRIGFDHAVRWARRPRLIEAHEQLVLGPETCWIGDSMRRDPSKCDAFENFIEGCGEAAGCALVSFERLWDLSEPVLTQSRAEREERAGRADGERKPSSAWAGAAAAEQAARESPGAAGETMPGALIATRH